MASQWIKVEHETADKPEVYIIAQELGLDPDTVFGKLIRLWIWCDQQIATGMKRGCNGESVTASVTDLLLDRVTHQAGFASALRKAGWIRDTKNGVEFVNLERHNGTTSKSRASANRRVAKHRDRNGETVTNVTPSPLQKPLPDEDEDEDTHTHTPAPVSRSSKPGPKRAWAIVTEEDAVAFANQVFQGIDPDIAREWFSFRTRDNWRKSGGEGARIADDQRHNDLSAHILGKKNSGRLKPVKAEQQPSDVSPTKLRKL